jgi:hypothetical protein
MQRNPPVTPRASDQAPFGTPSVRSTAPRASACARSRPIRPPPIAYPIYSVLPKKNGNKNQSPEPFPETRVARRSAQRTFHHLGTEMIVLKQQQWVRATRRGSGPLHGPTMLRRRRRLGPPTAVHPLLLPLLLGSDAQASPVPCRWRSRWARGITHVEAARNRWLSTTHTRRVAQARWRKTKRKA